MKKVLFILALVVLSLSLQAQTQRFDFKLKPIHTTPIMDLTSLTAVAAYWVYADKVEPDKVIHFLFGYFATNAMQSLLSVTDMPKGLKMFTPVIVFGGLAVFKELMDSEVELRDFYAGMAGCGVAVISFNISYKIKYK
jgi:hypothetical protein